MSYLNEREILDLLEHMEPTTILRQHDDKLNELGRQFLIQTQSEMEAGDSYLRDMGKRFRAENDRHWQSIESTRQPVKSRPATKRHLKITSSVVTAAAVIVVGLFMVESRNTIDPNQTRGRTTDLTDIQPLNDKLVEALIARGEFLLEAGNQTGKKSYYKEAKADLLQAYDLDPKNKSLLTFLVIVEEKLKNKRDAEKYYRELKE